MAATKRKVVEKSKVGEKPKAEEPVTEVEEVTEKEQSQADTPEQSPRLNSSDSCIFVKLSDGVMLDLMEVQSYVHEEGTMGRVYLKGGNSFQTPCGDELVKLIRRHRMYS